MFIQLKAIRIDNYGCEVRSGRVTIRKDQIAAINNSSSFNFDQETGMRHKSGFYRGSCVVHLISGKSFHVEDKFSEVEAMLLDNKDVN